MNRGNQNFTAPGNWGSRQDYGGYPMARRNNLPPVFPHHPSESPSLNPRPNVLEPWRMFQERAIGGRPLFIASIPGQRYYPSDQMIYIDNNAAARNTYQRQRWTSPEEPSPRFQGQWNFSPSPEDESKLTQDEQKQALNKLKKEVYFPLPKKLKRPNLYFREYPINSFRENFKEHDDEDGKNCPICLEDFEAKEVVTVTPCKHMFHEDCIVPWIKNQGKCPVCRYAICERLRENNGSIVPNNNMTADEQYEIDLISIIRAMEDSFISENRRLP